jgi:hypothetical protein
MIVYTTVTRLPLRVVTLLLPAEDISASPPQVSLLLRGDSVPVGLRFDETGKQVRFDDDRLTVQA